MNNTYSIENTLLKKLPLSTVEKSKKAIKLFNFGELNNKSIYRIINTVIAYLNECAISNEIKNKDILKRLNSKRKIKNLLKTAGIEISVNNIEPVTKEKLLLKEQISRITEKASRTNDYVRFLFFLLEITGLRIGEALGIKIDYYDKSDIKTLKGDIYYNDDNWVVKVVWRNDNPVDSRAKGQSSRKVFIRKNDAYEFEFLLDRYMKYRQRKVKNKKIEWLFITNRGTKLSQNTAYKRFKNILKEMCPEATSITLHSFRHTFCTNEILAGSPIELVAKIVGHSSPKTTFETYVHYSGKHMQEIREKYSYYIKGLENKWGDV